MQPCSSGLGMTLEASDFRSVRRLVAYSTKDLLAIVSSHKQALKAIAAAKSAISCKNRILSVRTTDFELLPCGSKATELLRILVATIIDHCPSVYANKLKIARGIFPNGLAIIDDFRKLVVYSSSIFPYKFPTKCLSKAVCF